MNPLSGIHNISSVRQAAFEAVIELHIIQLIVVIVGVDLMPL